MTGLWPHNSQQASADTRPGARDQALQRCQWDTHDQNLCRYGNTDEKACCLNLGLSHPSIVLKVRVAFCKITSDIERRAHTELGYDLDEHHCVGPGLEAWRVMGLLRCLTASSRPSDTMRYCSIYR